MGSNAIVIIYSLRTDNNHWFLEASTRHSFNGKKRTPFFLKLSQKKPGSTESFDNDFVWVVQPPMKANDWLSFWPMPLSIRLAEESAEFQVSRSFDFQSAIKHCRLERETGFHNSGIPVKYRKENTHPLDLTPDPPFCLSTINIWSLRKDTEVHCTNFMAKPKLGFWR